ncbi:ABC transporter substrate-binding protein [Streptomyces paludis]|uniref:Peptide ABC transporter substrate-binding protein n=1 Tax=Streptomyces paludis TaxID=2282738 RepID=A0A345HLV7_9ACTN|nr:ABC transporter substrate-binding protein [Streptomyces paludis]AXG77681.1 peptide ABC transporter substrate-binding protein [Streptomyces paludis]
MRRVLIGAGVVAVLVGTAACSGGAATGGGSGSRTLTLAPLVPAQPWDLKDAGLGNNTQYYQPVYDSLLRLDTEAEPKANLATEWSYDSTNTVLTLKLRDGVKFTDGTTLDAAAVKANLEHNKTGSQEAAGQLKGIKSVATEGTDTVRITLAAPDPSFVANLGSVAGMIASPKAIEAGTLKSTPVGSGPYTLDKSATTGGSVYTFVRNKDYWNIKAFPFDKIVLKPLNDPTAVLNALRSGQVDGALITTPKNVAAAKSGGLNILKYAPGDVAGVYIWDRGGKISPPLGKLKVRQAINYAFDRTELIKSVYQGDGQATAQVFNPTSTAYDTALNEKYPYDPAKAKALLAEAGYPKGFKVDIPDLSAIFPEAQAAMVQQLADVGITAKLVTVPPGEVINQLLAGKFAMSYMSLASFHSWDTVQIQIGKDTTWNIFKNQDPTVTKLINTAQHSTGAEQDTAFKELDTHLVDQAWNAPWAVVENSYAYSKKVKVVPQAFTPVPGIYNFTPAN